MLCKVRHGLTVSMPIALAETRTGRPGAFIRRAADLLTTADSSMSRLPFSFEFIRIAKAARRARAQPATVFSAEPIISGRQLRLQRGQIDLRVFFKRAG
jgi:hypothetical protein